MSRAELDNSANIMADEFGSVGSYQPLAGGTLDIDVVMTYGADVLSSDGASFERRDLAAVRMADVATPVQGDRLDVGTDSYLVDIWTVSGSMWQITLKASA